MTNNTQASQQVPSGMTDFIKAVNKLVFIARTSGGTAGVDDELCNALDVVEEHLLAQSATASTENKDYEHRHAVMQGECIKSCNDYFMARTTLLNTIANIKIFEAGFERGFDAALSKGIAHE